MGPDAAFVNPGYSSGSFLLGPGSHSISIQAIVSPFGSGRGYIKVDSIPAPVANDDSYDTAEDTSLTVSAGGDDVGPLGVLANDVSALGLLTAILVGVNGPGTVVLNENGSFTYTPPANFHGTATFTYKANDGEKDSNVATVTIAVASVNDAPVADSDSYVLNVTDEVSSLVVPAPGVLANDTDVDGDTLNAVQVSGPAHASFFVLNPGGSFTYTPAEGFSGTDMFTYHANDGASQGGDSNLAAVTITVNVPGNQTAAVNSFSPGTCEVSLQVTFDATNEDSFVIPPTNFLKHWHCRLFRVVEGGPDVELDPLSLHGEPGTTIDFGDPIGGGLASIFAGQTASFEARGSLCSLFSTLPDALYRAECTSASILPDPSEPGADGVCDADEECLDASLRTYVEAAPPFELGVAGGVVTGDECPQQLGNAAGSGCPFALSVLVTLNGAPLAGRTVRVFDRNHADFRQVTGGEKNPPRSLWPTIYEANKGAVGACVTDAAGRCTVGLRTSFDALALVKFAHPTTGAVDYDGSPFGPPADYKKDGVASKTIAIRR